MASEEDNYFKSKLKGIRSRCKKKNLEFDLTLKWLRAERKVTCPILGTKLYYTIGSGLVNSPENVPSIDRIDPSKGYVCDNCRIISYKANMILSNATLEELRMVYESMVRDCSDQNMALKGSKLCGKQ